MTDYEVIGRLAHDYYVAEVERVNARNRRNLERRSHPCAFETESTEPPCWAYTRYGALNASEAKRRTEWCENCLHVQPYYLAYQEAAKKARVTRYSMTRAIQRKLTPYPMNHKESGRSRCVRYF